MILIYQLQPSLLPIFKKTMLVQHINKCFSRNFPIDRLDEYARAAVYQEAGQIKALAMVREVDKGGHTLSIPTVECVSVVPEARHGGIAREVLEFVQSDLGYLKLMLHIDKPNNSFYELAKNLYGSVGFVVAREDDLECEMVWEKEEKRV